MSDFRVWRPQIDALDALGWKAVALRLEGYYPDTFVAERFSADRQVNAIGSFLVDLEHPVHLVGHSRGGRLALGVAADFPECLLSLTLLEAGGAREPDFFRSAATPGAEGPPPLVRAIEILDQGRPEDALRHYVDATQGEGAWARSPEFFKSSAIDNAVTLKGMAADRSRPLTRADARRVSCQTLLIEGSDSPADFHRVADVLEEEIPNVRRIQIEGADHFLPMTHPNPINDAIIAFIKQTATLAASV